MVNKDSGRQLLRTFELPFINTDFTFAIFHKSGYVFVRNILLMTVERPRLNSWAVSLISLLLMLSKPAAFIGFHFLQAASIFKTSGSAKLFMAGVTL